MVKNKCSNASHELMKNDDATWDALPVNYEMPFKADAYGPAEVIRFKDCPHCKSTLGRAYPVAS
jgi:hypothetical protein